MCFKGVLFLHKAYNSYSIISFIGTPYIYMCVCVICCLVCALVTPRMDNNKTCVEREWTTCSKYNMSF